LISVDLYLGQHAKEAAEGELTNDIRANAAVLVQRVNRLLEAFLADTSLPRVLRSGWRPSGFNASFQHTDASGAMVRGGAQHSKHMTGEGVDLADNDGKLDEWLSDERLVQFDLYREHPDATPSWCHLQMVAPGSGRRTFRP